VIDNNPRVEKTGIAKSRMKDNDGHKQKQQEVSIKHMGDCKNDGEWISRFQECVQVKENVKGGKADMYQNWKCSRSRLCNCKQETSAVCIYDTDKVIHFLLDPKPIIHSKLVIHHTNTIETSNDLLRQTQDP